MAFGFPLWKPGYVLTFRGTQGGILSWSGEPGGCPSLLGSCEGLPLDQGGLGGLALPACLAASPTSVPHSPAGVGASITVCPAAPWEPSLSFVPPSMVAGRGEDSLTFCTFTTHHLFVYHTRLFLVFLPLVNSYSFFKWQFKQVFLRGAISDLPEQVKNSLI